MDSALTLAQLPPGTVALVTGLREEGASRNRLLDLGLVPGTPVRALRRSPLGDPTAYEIRGAVIALRAEEAGLVFIHPLTTIKPAPGKEGQQ